MDKLRLGFVLIAAAWLLGYTGLTYSWGGSNQGLMRWLQSAQVFRVTRDIDCFEHETGSGPEFELCRTFWEPLETDIIFNPRPLLVFSIPASVYFFNRTGGRCCRARPGHLLDLGFSQETSLNGLPRRSILPHNKEELMLRIERLFFSDSEELVLTFRDELKVLTFQVFAKSDARYRGVPNTSVQ